MNGHYPVDVAEYSREVHDYLIGRGAAEFQGWVSRFTPLDLENFVPTAFLGCKPTHFGATIRIFFPNEDEALLFSLAFGHLIKSSYIKRLHQLIEDSRE